MRKYKVGILMKTVKNFAEAKKSENSCQCCEALGLHDIVDLLFKNDVSSDAKKRKRGRPRKQIEVFIDKDHEVMYRFYEIAEKNISNAKMLKEMQKLISEDPNFLDPYLVVADILSSQNQNKKAAAILHEAYERALMIIVDEMGRWPKELPWGFLENRHIMRAINQQALFYWEIGKIDEALDIFRKLLRVNPQDNQGVRYNILAIKMGLGIDEWTKPFGVQEDGEILGLDAFKVSDWFDKNSKKFEDEFKWLIDLYKSWEEE